MTDETSGPEPADQPRRLRRLAEDGTYVDYSPAEYGVRKDSGGGFIAPITSVLGLAFLTLLATIGVVVAVVATVYMVVTDQANVIAASWWVYLAVAFVAWAAWSSFLTELRAARLRARRGLPRPVE
jgi:hypothetical protein